MDNFYVDMYKRIWGNKAIEKSTVINENNNEITLLSDVHEYSFKVPSNTYISLYGADSSELVDAIKNVIQNNSYPINVYYGGYHKDTKYNTIVFGMQDGSDITAITGSFFDGFFK